MYVVPERQDRLPHIQLLVSCCNSQLVCVTMAADAGDGALLFDVPEEWKEGATEDDSAAAAAALAASYDTSFVPRVLESFVSFHPVESEWERVSLWLQGSARLRDNETGRQADRQIYRQIDSQRRRDNRQNNNLRAREREKERNGWSQSTEEATLVTRGYGLVLHPRFPLPCARSAWERQ